MFDSNKLSLWDVFNNLSIGLLLFISIISFSILYFNEDDYMKFFDLLSKFSSVLVITLPILLLLLGMLLDGLSNRFKEVHSIILLLKSKETDKSNYNIKSKVRKIIPELINEREMFRYCKAYVAQNCKNDNVDVFLARFGFYKNISFILLAFSILPFIYLSISFSILLSLTILFFSRVFLQRSKHFKKLIEKEVYYNYLSLILKQG